MKLEEVVPWGRSFDEYVRMFALTDADLTSRILSCADGPAAFNAGMTARGHRAVSVDPLYAFDAPAIRRRIAETYETVVQWARDNRDAFVWREITSPEEIGRVRMAAMEAFLTDCEAGGRAGRYVAAALPHLPFGQMTFDLALCSHFLFTYSGPLSVEFHVNAMLEMCRTSREVRVFPLLDADGSPSPHVTPVADQLRARGYSVSITNVPYEFQVGGDKMVIVHRRGR
jgi:hypothetical protein